MLAEWLMPQLHEDNDNFIFQQDGAPPHWHQHLRHYLDANLSQRWIGRVTANNICLACWLQRNTDLIPCDFFLWGFIKDNVFAPPLPAKTIAEC